MGELSLTRHFWADHRDLHAAIDAYLELQSQVSRECRHLFGKWRRWMKDCFRHRSAPVHVPGRVGLGRQSLGGQGRRRRVVVHVSGRVGFG